MLASCSSPRSRPAKTMGSLRPLPCPPQPVQPGWPARTMPPRSMPTWTKLTSSGSFCSGLQSVQSSRAEMPTTRPYSRPYCGMFSTGSSKPKKHVPTQGRCVKRTYCSIFGHALGGGGRGQQLALEVAGEVDPLLAVAEGRAEGVGRLRLGHAGQDGRRADRAAVVHAALDLVPQLGVEHQALGHADGGDERVARLHRHGQLLDQRRVEPVPHAAVVGDLHRGRRIEHEAVADALRLRALLVHAVQLASWGSPLP